MRRIDHDDDVAFGLEQLRRIDPRLAPIIETAGPIPLRRRPAGFEGLARIVVSQQVSAAAATSIWGRVERLVGLSAAADDFARHDDAALKSAGLSTPKVRTLRAMTEACAGGLELAALVDLSAAEAIEKLISIKGIGPWTAEVWLLFCAGHPDVWPAGDLALRAALGDGLGFAERPTEAVCRAAAAAWTPWRGVAARLFWAYYAARRGGREGVPT